MKKQLVLSGVALSVLMLAATPAFAQLNLDLDNGVAVELNLDGDGNGNLVDLNGDGEAIVDVDLGAGDDGDLVDLDGNGIIDADDLDVTVDLFGPAKNGHTRLAVGSGVNGDDDDAIVTLFGPRGDSDVANVNLFPSGHDTGPAGAADVTLDLFGPDPVEQDPTETGSIPQHGGNGNGIGDGDGNGTGNGPGGRATEIAAAGSDDPRLARPAGNVRVAATGNAADDGNCFTPDDTQIAHLVNRNSYDASVTASWQSAAKISLVPIKLCPEAESKVVAALNAHAGIGVMQAAVSANARIRSALGGRGPGNVLAIDQAGDTLTVYVF